MSELNQVKELLNKKQSNLITGLTDFDRELIAMKAQMDKERD